MIEQVRALATQVGVTRACQVLAMPRSWFYRTPIRPRGAALGTNRRPAPERALNPAQRAEVRDVLNSERFGDQTPRQVWACLLDEGRYLCSWRTMYRILDTYTEVRERRNQRRHPTYTKPELMATAPNQVWTWDITKLRGPVKGVYYYLYVILDLFSRYVVGWMVAPRETAALAQVLIDTTCQRQGIDPEQLTLHADRGSPMIAKSTSELLVDLGVVKSHSRPQVCNDNPYSEAPFKTLKYRPDFPDRFGAIEDARAWCLPFFHWYNEHHYHTGLGLLTPASVHDQRHDAVQDHRQGILDAAYAAHPNRFVGGRPTVQPLPEAVWINPPKQKETQTEYSSLNSSNKVSQSP
jgi:putative transposase